MSENVDGSKEPIADTDISCIKIDFPSTVSNYENQPVMVFFFFLVYLISFAESNKVAI